MKKTTYLLGIISLIASCKLSNNNSTREDNKELAAMLNRYYEERLQLFPVEATANGDNRYNDKLYVDFTDGYRKKLRDFFGNYLIYINHFKRENLNDNDRLSYDIFKKSFPGFSSQFSFLHF